VSAPEDPTQPPSPPPEMLEIVPEPSAGRVFARAQVPGAADVTGTGRARLDAIARWLQDVARDDTRDAGFEGRGVWIVRRTRIRVAAFPRFDDRLELRTFCSGIARFSAERRTSIRGGGADVDAVSRWIFLDPEGRRPQRFGGDFRAAYAESAGDRDANVRSRHPDPPEGAEGEPWPFRATDLDIAGHVNNSHYWGPFEQDLLGSGDPAAFDGEVEHRDPAQPGDARLVRGDGVSWIVGHGGAVHASLVGGVE
jgi:acyl-ACP thioesterase